MFDFVPDTERQRVLSEMDEEMRQSKAQLTKLKRVLERRKIRRGHFDKLWSDTESIRNSRVSFAEIPLLEVLQTWSVQIPPSSVAADDNILTLSQTLSFTHNPQKLFMRYINRLLHR